jgi:hypothetical protein
MRRWKALAAATALSLTAVTATTVLEVGQGAASTPTVEHCAVRVTGMDPDGHLRTTAPACSSDQASAMRAVGTTSSDFPIGVHFDGPGLTGSSFTVVGSSCSGGWLNLNSLWINRVSSTENHCPTIRHFDGYNLTGASEYTFGAGGNLSVLNNATNSIQYLP